MDWNRFFDTVADVGLTVYDDQTYSEEERQGDALTAAQIELERERIAAVNAAQSSSGSIGGMDTTTLLLIGGALVAVLVLAK